MSPLTVAVLGATDSGAEALAERLERAGAGTVVALPHARCDARPDVAVLTLDPVCPVRPDDVVVARRVSASVPLVPVHVDDGTRPDVVATSLRSAVRLAAAGLPAPVVLALHPVPTGEGGMDEVSFLDRVRAAAGSSPLPPDRGLRTGVVGGGRGGAADPARVLDWLTARRTEAITSRSASLRREVQNLRLDLVRDLHRDLREIGHESREAIDRASIPALPTLVRSVASRADDAVAGLVHRCDSAVARLLVRHLGPGAPAPATGDAPTSGLVPVAPPRHRGEESLTMLMGAAGGTGVGRMLLAPLAEAGDVGLAVVPAAVAVGVGLGAATVRIRRTQSARTHALAVVTDRLAGLRAEAEQALGVRVLAAESAVADGFAHDPGPRVVDLDRRIRTLRATATPAGVSV